MAVAAPSVELEPEAGRVVIEVSLPDFATVDTFTVRRTNTETGVTRDVRTLIDVEPLGTLTQGFDYELPIGIPVTYAVTAYRAGVPETSPPSPPVLWATTDFWLKDIAQPERNLRVTVEALSQVSYDQPQGVYSVLGRRNPVVVSDVQSGQVGTLNLVTLTLEERTALLALLAPAPVLLFQAAPEYGTGPGPLYLVPGPLGEERPSRRGHVPARRWALAFTEVDSPDLAIIVSDFTYQTVLDAYADYQAVLDGEVSYYDLLTSPGLDASATAVATASAARSGPVPVEVGSPFAWGWPELTPEMR